MALSDFEVGSLGELFERWGYPRGNAGRLLRRYYNCGGEGLDGTVVSPVVASRLVREVRLRGASVGARAEAGDGTVKLLVGLGEGEHRPSNIERLTSNEDVSAQPTPAYRLLPTAYSST